LEKLACAGCSLSDQHILSDKYTKKSKIQNTKF